MTEPTPPDDETDAAFATPRERPLWNVAPRGIASQSSTSRWSLPDDATGGQQPHDRAFGFHTELEDGPWWRLDFQAPCTPQGIVVRNRRGMLQERASELIVEASVDGETWILLHQGLCHFGSGEAGDAPALVLPIGGKVPLSALRLRVPGRTYLHLCWVEVWIDGHSAMTFLAMRGDGFGARLQALLTAAMLAEHVGGDFRVAWPELRALDAGAHVVQPIEQTFSAGFLARHQAAPGLDRGFPRLRRESMLYTASNLRVDFPLEKVAAGVAARLAPGAGQRAFARVEFAPHLERARQAALAFDMPADAAALHLRAGDIVYGPYRFLGHYAGKVIPWPLAFAQARKLTDAGMMVLIFGQDPELCRLLASHHGAIFVGDAVERLGLDRHQAALFEIALMARCARIYAGESDFANVAGLISGVRVEAAPNGLARRELRRAFLQAERSPEPVSDLQRAFSAWWAARHFRSLFEPAEVTHFIATAAALDPDNALYRLLQVRDEIVAGRPAAAARALLAVAIENRSSLLFLLKERRLARLSLPRTLVESFAGLAEAGDPVAVLCEALVAEEPAVARAAARRFLMLRPSELSFYDAEAERLLGAA